MAGSGWSERKADDGHRGRLPEDRYNHRTLKNGEGECSSRRRQLAFFNLREKHFKRSFPMTIVMKFRLAECAQTYVAGWRMT